MSDPGAESLLDRFAPRITCDREENQAGEHQSCASDERAHDRAEAEPGRDQDELRGQAEERPRSDDEHEDEGADGAEAGRPVSNRIRGELDAQAGAKMGSERVDQDDHESEAEGASERFSQAGHVEEHTPIGSAGCGHVLPVR